MKQFIVVLYFIETCQEVCKRFGGDLLKMCLVYLLPLHLDPNGV